MSIPKSCSCLKELFAIYPEITAQNYSKPFLPNLHTVQTRKRVFKSQKKGHHLTTLDQISGFFDSKYRIPITQITQDLKLLNLNCRG